MGIGNRLEHKWNKGSNAFADLIGSVVHAMLVIYEPPLGFSHSKGPLIKSIAFDFNPTELSLSRRANWNSTPSAGARGGSMPEFLGSEPRSLSVSIFLDRSDDPDSDDVMDDVADLFKCCEVTRMSQWARQPSTPWVVFEWGSFKTARFTAYVESVDATYTVFNTSGMPIRATAQLQLREIPTKTMGQNPTSGALTARRVHRLVAGDSLQSLAFREYGDATAWRAIAEANGIDDPARITSGTELVLPAAEEVTGP
jgi:phage tail protein X